MQRQDDQLEPTCRFSVQIRGVALRTYRKQWTIEKGAERELGIFVLMARYDDDIYMFCKGIFWRKLLKEPEIVCLNSVKSSNTIYNLHRDDGFIYFYLTLNVLLASLNCNQVLILFDVYNLYTQLNGFK